MRAAFRRIFGTPRRTPPDSGGPRRLGELLTVASPVEVVSASISNHVARVVLADPLPPAPDDLIQNRLLEAAWRALREHPAEGPIRTLEVWAPQGSGGPPERALLREFKAALDVPAPVSIRPTPAHPGPHFAGLGETTGGAAGPPEPVPQGLRALGAFLVIPERLSVRLRTRGVDPAAPDLSRLVEALLGEVGYDVTARKEEGRLIDLEGVSEAGRVVVRCYHTDGHVLPPTIDRFAYSFLSGRGDEAFFITDGLLPFEARHWERDPRIHLLDRVGLQRLIEAVASRISFAPPGSVSPR